MSCDAATVEANGGTRLLTGVVRANQSLCREHFRLTMRVAAFATARPGQFVHLCPVLAGGSDHQRAACEDVTPHVMQGAFLDHPMLRRAYSVAGLRETDDGIEVDVIYRVVGRGTRWLATLRAGDVLSVLGPLGNEFPISHTKRNAWMVSGGVGLPPMLYLAQALQAGKRNVIAFCGAQSRDLLALSLNDQTLPTRDAKTATRCVNEFARHGFGSVISTDDGSLGFHGHIGAALTAYAEANPPDVSDLVVYSCGPERMMRFVADFCAARAIECYLCMERAMACGTGMCQSCVVPVTDSTDPAGWRYRLCCTDGPVFSASDIFWEPAAALR